MNENCLLNLVVTPEVEDAVADWLLEYPTVTGFSSYPISGHGSSEQRMTLAEQVAGRRDGDRASDEGKEVLATFVHRIHGVSARELN